MAEKLILKRRINDFHSGSRFFGMRIPERLIRKNIPDISLSAYWILGMTARSNGWIDLIPSKALKMRWKSRGFCTINQDHCGLSSIDKKNTGGRTFSGSPAAKYQKGVFAL